MCIIRHRAHPEGGAYFGPPGIAAIRVYDCPRLPRFTFPYLVFPYSVSEAFRRYLHVLGISN